MKFFEITSVFVSELKSSGLIFTLLFIKQKKASVRTAANSRIEKIRNRMEYLSIKSFAENLKSERMFVRRIVRESRKINMFSVESCHTRMFKIEMMKATGDSITAASIFEFFVKKILAIQTDSRKITKICEIKHECITVF